MVLSSRRRFDVDVSSLNKQIICLTTEAGTEWANQDGGLKALRTNSLFCTEDGNAFYLFIYL